MPPLYTYVDIHTLHQNLPLNTSITYLIVTLRFCAWVTLRLGIGMHEELTLHGFYCLYSSSQALLKSSQCEGTLRDAYSNIGGDAISCDPGHICSRLPWMTIHMELSKVTMVLWKHPYCNKRSPG